MRIENYQQIAQIYGTQTTYNNQRVSDAASSKGSDQLSISQMAYSHQAAKNAVSEASDIREDRIAKIKAQIQAGTYYVSPEAFADKLLQNYNAVV